MLNQTTHSSTALTRLRGDQPLAIITRPANDSSASAQAVDYAQLLAAFPPSLHNGIGQVLPALEDLQAFHQGFLERESPLTEKAVLHALQAIFDHRVATDEQQRLGHIIAFQRDDHLRAHDVYGATLLHHAILNEDLGLARTLLATPNVDSAAIVQPTLRHRDLARIGFALSTLPDHAGPADMQHAILGALKRRETLGGRSAQAFASHAGDNPLSFALTRHASGEMVRLLVDHYAAHAPAMLWRPDANGVPPIVAAAGSGRQDLVQLLLKQTAVDINGSNGQGCNALMATVISGDTALLELLLSAHPNLEARDRQGRTVQDLALACGNGSAYVKLVMHQWATNPSAAALGRVNAQIARDFQAAAASGDVAMLKLMLDHFRLMLGRDVIASALAMSVRIPGQSAVVACLLDPSQTGVAADTLVRPGLELIAADAAIFHVLATSIYTQSAADVSRLKLEGLMYRAAALGLAQWVHYALEGDIDPDEIDATDGASHGKLLLLQALQLEKPEMLKALLAPGAPLQRWLKTNPDSVEAILADAAALGKAQAVELVLQACPPSPDHDEAQSLRWLALAASAGSTRACELILNKTGLVMPLTATRRQNPLLQALIHGRHDVLAFLLSRGAHGCLKYKTVYKSAIEKALTLKDAKAVATILACDRYLASELPPLFDKLFEIAIDQDDKASFEPLVKALLRFERSPKKLRQCAEQAMAVGCAGAFKLLITAETIRQMSAYDRESFFRKLICLPIPAPEMVMHWLHVEGHPRTSAHTLDDGSHVLDVESSGAKHLVNALLAADTNDEQKIYWMATILCQTHLDTSFVSMRDLSINQWGRLVAPLARSMKGDDSYSAALGLAAMMAVKVGRPGPVCEILFDITPRVLDVEIDLMPAAESILATKRLELLPCLPSDIQQRLQAKYKTQLGAPYTH